MLFEAKALNLKQELVVFSIEGKNEQEVREALAQKKLKVLELKPVKKKPIAALLALPTKDRIGSAELLNFTRFLHVMLKSGVPLDRSLALIMKRASGDKMKEMIAALQIGLNQGKPLSKIFGAYEEQVGPIYVEMLKVGEVGGNLEDSLKFLVDYLEKSAELKNKVISSLVYPLVLVVVGMIVAGIFVFFITPKFVELFAGSNVDLPVALKTMIIINNVLTASPILTIFGIVLLISLIIWKKRQVKIALIAFSKKIPGIRTIILNVQIARMSLVLASLFKAGVPALQALDIAVDAMKDTPMQADLSEVVKGVTKGEKISQVLYRSSKTIPEIYIQIIEVGEESATLDESFDFLAGFYNDEVDRQLKRSLTLLEPAMLLLVGLGVGILVISVMLPIYQSISAQ